MDMDWTKDGKVSVSIIKYLHKVLEEFIEEIKKTSMTPSADYLFKIREKIDAAKLPEELAVMFHHTVAQLLFLCQRARRDIQTPVSFLTKRVKRPDKDDWNKLVRCLQYLKATIHMKLTLRVDSMSILNWFIDSSHQVHEDCKGHTGGALTLGKGAVLSKSMGQKINTKSSSESELVGVDDVLPTVLHTRYFIEAQGFSVEHNIIHQDNESTLRMLINGKKSCTARSKHIKAKNFLAKDKHDQKEIEFAKCHTTEMWVDMLTKPKQGTPFRKDRNMLMNVDIDYDDELERKNTDSRLLPNPDKEQPFIWSHSTIGRPKTTNRRRSVLGTAKPKSKFGRSHIEPNHNKTRNCISSDTEPNHVSWADMVRRKPIQISPICG